jgi:serine O-acetyltransferase
MKPQPMHPSLALQKFIVAVRADYASVQNNRAKYHAEKVSLWRMPIDLVRKVGFQTLAVTRLMQLARDLRVPIAPQVLSRLLRHLYSSEIHWDADIAPGVSIVHGVGLVISHAATVGEQCILFHNVTLGEGLDKNTRERGAPTLEARVHVGPGATLLGPIVVGEGSKIGAGAVLDHSVPPHSLVMPQAAKVSSRAPRRTDA